MKLPFDLGVKLLFRLLIPGFFLALGFIPPLYTLWDWGGWSFQREYAFLLGVMLMGWLLVVLDYPIYMFFEGRRYWIRPVRKLFMQLEENRLKRNIEKEKKFYALSLWREGNERVLFYRKSLEAWGEIRNFPMNDKGHYEVQYPSRLGNLITAFEGYSSLRYGMHGVFYWSRIWIKLDKDLREEVDNSQAIADSAVYTSFALYVNAFLWFMYSILQLVQISLIKHLPGNKFSWILFVVFLLSGYLVYRLSIYPNDQYGKLFKSIYDIYQKEIDIDPIIEKIALLMNNSSLTTLDRDQKLRVAQHYLLNYRVRCPRCNSSVSPAEIGSPNCKHNIY